MPVASPPTARRHRPMASSRGGRSAATAQAPRRTSSSPEEDTAVAAPRRTRSLSPRFVTGIRCPLATIYEDETPALAGSAFGAWAMSSLPELSQRNANFPRSPSSFRPTPLAVDAAIAVLPTDHPSDDDEHDDDEFDNSFMMSFGHSSLPSLDLTGSSSTSISSSSPQHASSSSISSIQLHSSQHSLGDEFSHHHISQLTQDGLEVTSDDSPYASPRQDEYLLVPLSGSSLPQSSVPTSPPLSHRFSTSFHRMKPKLLHTSVGPLSSSPLERHPVPLPPPPLDTEDPQFAAAKIESAVGTTLVSAAHKRMMQTVTDATDTVASFFQHRDTPAIVQEPPAAVSASQLRTDHDKPPQFICNRHASL
jgi:hypothetical protein